MERSRRIALAVFPPGVTALVLIIMISGGHWNLAGIWIEPSVIGWPTGFADLANVTNTSECIMDRAPVEACDPYGRPFQPYVVIPAHVLALLGFGLSSTGVIGVLLAILWVFVIGVLSWWLSISWSRSFRELLAALAVLTMTAIAPPSLLGVERGSLDIAVITLAGAGLLLTAIRTRTLSTLLGSLALTGAVVLKYFAIGVFAAYLAPRRWRLLPILAAAASVIFLSLNSSNLLLARETAESTQLATSRVQFSSTTALVTLITQDSRAFFPADGQELNVFALRVIGVLIVLVWAAVFLVVLRAKQQPPYVSWLLIVGGGFLLLIPYFLGESNDYRLMALVLPLAGLIRWRSCGSRALWLPIGLILGAMVTGAAMVPNQFDWLLPKAALIAGDVALAGVLGFVIAVWIRQWLSESNSLVVGSSESDR